MQDVEKMGGRGQEGSAGTCCTLLYHFDRIPPHRPGIMQGPELYMFKLAFRHASRTFVNPEQDKINTKSQKKKLVQVLPTKGEQNLVPIVVTAASELVA